MTYTWANAEQTALYLTEEGSTGSTYIPAVVGNRDYYAFLQSGATAEPYVEPGDTVPAPDPLELRVIALEEQISTLETSVNILIEWNREVIEEEYNHITDPTVKDQLVAAKQAHLECKLLCETDYCDSICNAQYAEALAEILEGVGDN